MAAIRTIRDVENEIRKIHDELAQLRTGNQDLHGNRIINAGRSRAPSDYVIKAELDDLEAGVTTVIDNTTVVQGGSSGAQSLNQVDFVVHSILSVQSNAAAQVSFSGDLLVVELEATVKQAPVGANLLFKIKTDEATFIEDVLISADTLTTGLITENLGTIAARQLVTIDITQVGTDFPGSDLTISLRS